MSDAPRRLTRLVLPGVAVVVLVGFLVVGVLPSRSLWDKYAQAETAEARLAELDDENATLQARVDALGTDAEVERIAREEYGLVRPGEEAYRVLPPPEDPVATPGVWPFAGLRAELSVPPPPDPATEP